MASQVQAAAIAQNVPSLAATLRQAGKLAAQLGRYPMPTCADPKGYWSLIVAHLKAAGDTASTKRGVSALMAAAAPLEKIPLVEAQLSAELTSTAGT